MACEVVQLRLELFSGVSRSLRFIVNPGRPDRTEAPEIVLTALHVHSALQGRHVDVVELVVALADVGYLISDVASGFRCEVEGQEFGAVRKVLHVW